MKKIIYFSTLIAGLTNLAVASESESGAVDQTENGRVSPASSASSVDDDAAATVTGGEEDPKKTDWVSALGICQSQLEATLGLTRKNELSDVFNTFKACLDQMVQDAKLNAEAAQSTSSTVPPLNVNGVSSFPESPVVAGPPAADDNQSDAASNTASQKGDASGGDEEGASGGEADGAANGPDTDDGKSSGTASKTASQTSDTSDDGQPADAVTGAANGPDTDDEQSSGTDEDGRMGAVAQNTAAGE